MTVTLRTKVCEILGIEYPVLLAGMGPTTGGGLGSAATAPLVAAVSEAGGLGVIGGAGFTPEALREEIRKVRAQTSKPFGVDLLMPANLYQGEARPAGATTAAAPAGGWREQVPAEYWEKIDALKRRFNIPDVPPPETPRTAGRWRIEEQVEVVLEERVPVLASGLGNPAPYVPRCRELGIKVIALVGNTKNARRVAEGGVDIVVAQGTEAGGHTGRVGTMALIPQVVDAVAPTPVVAAGGIADGRGLAAALALGAHGVWCGTAFLATQEANLYDWQKRRIVEASEEDTVVTRLYSGKTMRNVTNPLIEAWEALNIKALPMGLQGLLIADLVAGARASGQDELLMNAAGQAAGLISALKPAAQVLNEMVEGAVAVLSERLPAAVQLAAPAGAGR